VAIRMFLRAVLFLLFWACVVVWFCVSSGCTHKLDRNTYPDREWSEAWDCRCDTCCETLSRIEADYLADAREGEQR